MDFNYPASLHTPIQQASFPVLPTHEDNGSYTGLLDPGLPTSTGIPVLGGNGFGIPNAVHLLPDPMASNGFDGHYTYNARTSAISGESPDAASIPLTVIEKPAPLPTNVPSNTAVKARKAARESFELDFDRLMQKLKQDISELAEKHNKKESYIESMVFNGGTNYLRESKPSAWNAWLHHKYQELNEG
jgi:hypothetical protein